MLRPTARFSVQGIPGEESSEARDPGLDVVERRSVVEPKTCAEEKRAKSSAAEEGAALREAAVSPAAFSLTAAGSFKWTRQKCSNFSSHGKCIRVTSVLFTSRAELHSHTRPDKWRTSEALHTFFSDIPSALGAGTNSQKSLCSEFTSHTTRALDFWGKSPAAPQIWLPPTEPDVAYISYENYEHLRHFTRFRQQLICGMWCEVLLMFILK